MLSAVGQGGKTDSAVCYRNKQTFVDPDFIKHLIINVKLSLRVKKQTFCQKIPEIPYLFIWIDLAQNK